MAELKQVMLRVLDLDRSKAFYEATLGLHETARFDMGDFELMFLANDEASVELELTRNKSVTEPYEHGTAFGHIGVLVDDARALRARLEADGLKPDTLIEYELEGLVAARLFFVTDPDGYRIEFIERLGRYARQSHAA